MEAFRVCASCSCHVRSRDLRCPFCGVPRAVAPQEAPPRAVRRVSRGGWLAFGSLALAGCMGNVAQPPAQDGGATTTQPVASSTDAGSDAQTSCAFDPSATFECGGGTMCNRATQWCQLARSGTPEGCVADDQGYPFPPECIDCPTLACVQAHMTGTCHAVDASGGIGISCIGCYGAPPARLERLFA